MRTRRSWTVPTTSMVAADGSRSAAPAAALQVVAAAAAAQDRTAVAFGTKWKEVFVAMICGTRIQKKSFWQH